MQRKSQMYPGQFDLLEMNKVKTLREFDNVITARYCGFLDATDYYNRSSAMRVAANIQIPAMIVTAQDDPFVPFFIFSDEALTDNPRIQLVAPKHGGHCAFISRYSGEERFWAENCLMEFFKTTRA
jgi:predicted alpha/beta-fold hydrolase